MPIKVAVDQGANLPALQKLADHDKITLHQAHDLEQKFRKVIQQRRAARYGVGQYGVDAYGNKKLVEQIEQIVGPKNTADVDHIYAAHINRCDYFVTENVRHFIAGGRRERLERLLGVKIRRTAEFLAEICPQEGGEGTES